MALRMAKTLNGSDAVKRQALEPVEAAAINMLNESHSHSLEDAGVAELLA